MPDENQPQGDIVMEWTFPEFVRHQRGRGWYLGFYALVLALLAYAVWIENYTFAAVIFLASMVLVIRLRRHPPDVQFAIREEGLEVGSGFYFWKDLKEFWILYQPPDVKRLYVGFKNVYRPVLDVSLEQQNPLQVREAMSEFLPENVNKEDEPGSDQLSRFLKI